MNTKIFVLDMANSKKKIIQKVFFSAYKEFLAENDVFWKSKPMKIWNFGEYKKCLFLIWSIQKKIIQKVIFSAYGEFLAENDVSWKSKPLKIWNFGKTKNVCSWYGQFKKK